MTDPDMIAFVRARLDEDGELARSGFSHPGRWVRVAVPGTQRGVPNGLSCPAVLADVEFKQQVLDLHEDNPGPDLGAVVRRMALLFHAHPAYRKEWAP